METNNSEFIKIRNLQFVERTIFYSRPKARMIDIADNNIKQLDLGAFNNALYLEVLNASSSKIQILVMTSIINNQALRAISLQNNLIANITYDVFSCFPNLEKLDLSFNNIVRIDRLAFKTLKKLKMLNLAYNNLIMLSDDIFSENLEMAVCSLEVNNFQILPKSLLCIPNCTIKIASTPIHKITGTDQAKIREYIAQQYDNYQD